MDLLLNRASHSCETASGMYGGVVVVEMGVPVMLNCLVKDSSASGSSRDTTRGQLCRQCCSDLELLMNP